MSVRYRDIHHNLWELFSIREGMLENLEYVQKRYNDLFNFTVGVLVAAELGSGASVSQIKQLLEEAGLKK